LIVTNSLAELTAEIGPNPLRLEADILALISAACAKLNGEVERSSMGMEQLVEAATKEAPVHVDASTNVPELD
jgi:hypothetical protein